MAKNRSLSKKTLRGDGQNVPGAYKLGQKPTPTESFSHPANNLDLDKYIKAVIADSDGDFADGTALDPSISFANDEDLGLFRDSADTLGITANGSKVGEWGTDGLIVQTGDLLIQDGTASDPSLAFDSDEDSGLYRPSVDTIGFTVNGTQAATLDTAGFKDTSFYADDGTPAVPGFTFGNDQDTGFYRIGADNIGLSLGNSKIVDYGSSTIEFDALLDLNGNGTSLIFTKDSATNFVDVDNSGNGGFTVSNDGMTADPETGTEDGYITIRIGGNTYQVPIYAA